MTRNLASYEAQGAQQEKVSQILTQARSQEVVWPEIVPLCESTSSNTIEMTGCNATTSYSRALAITL
jgi:hypothetical protein